MLEVKPEGAQGRNDCIAKDAGGAMNTIDGKIMNKTDYMETAMLLAGIALVFALVIVAARLCR